MSDPFIVLAKIKQGGGSVTSDGADLTIRIPKGLLTSEDRTTLSEHKPRLVQLLQSTIDQAERSAIAWVENASATELEQAHSEVLTAFESTTGA